MASISVIFINYVIGGTAKQSVLNLSDWLNCMGKNICLASDCRGTRIKGVFQQMKLSECFHFITAVDNITIVLGNVRHLIRHVGMWLSFGGSGRGSAVVTHHLIVPFISVS